LRSNEQMSSLHKVIKLIKNQTDRPKSELVAGYFDSHSSGTKLTGASKTQAFDLALGALIMVPFSNRNRYYQQYPILLQKPGQTINRLILLCIML
jgi:hypothetical protein